MTPPSNAGGEGREVLARELAARLLAYRPTDEWGDGVHHVICDEAAQLLIAFSARENADDRAPALVEAAAEMREALVAWRDAQKATDDAVEHLERAVAEGWWNEPGASSHVGESDRRADAAWERAVKLRDAALSAALDAQEASNVG